MTQVIREVGAWRVPMGLGFPNKQKLSWVLSGISGLLLFAAFPPIGAAHLAFVALIPLLFALRWNSASRCRLGFLAGCCFWIPSLWFLSPVTIPGALLLSVYCALYWIPLGFVWGAALSRWSPHRIGESILFLLSGSALWCALEWVKGWFLTGFPWYDLAVSQWENYGLLQLASLGGTGLISFLIMMMNIGIALSLMGLFEQLGTGRKNRMHPELYLPILLLCIGFTWGMRQLRERLPESQEDQRVVRIAAIQPLADNKWTDELVAENFRILWELSDAAMSLRPDLMVWPETAIPEELRYSPKAVSLVQSLVSDGTPLLVGSLDFETVSVEDQVERIYYNSSFLVNSNGDIQSEYQKQHLVMFGEYMPLASWLPFLRALTPMPEDVTPGTGSGVMTVPSLNLRMGMIICFEDLMPGLTRNRTREGAEVFVNQTNDAWFDPLWGSQAHLAHAVFRSVEQRRPTVRVTNSGVSAWIDTRGVVRDRIEDPLTGQFRIRGFKTFEVEIPGELETTFFYTYSTLFPITWILFSLISIFGIGIKKL